MADFGLSTEGLRSTAAGRQPGPPFRWLFSTFPLAFLDSKLPCRLPLAFHCLVHCISLSLPLPFLRYSTLPFVTAFVTFTACLRPSTAFLATFSSHSHRLSPTFHTFHLFSLWFRHHPPGGSEGGGSGQSVEAVGTYQWMAPELMKGLRPTLRADVFSFAVRAPAAVFLVLGDKWSCFCDKCPSCVLFHRPPRRRWCCGSCWRWRNRGPGSTTRSCCSTQSAPSKTARPSRTQVRAPYDNIACPPTHGLSPDTMALITSGPHNMDYFPARWL